MMVSLLLALSAQVAAPADGEAPRPLVVVLFPKADQRSQAPDLRQWPGTLQSELGSAARYADVLLVADAASNARVVDPATVACTDVSCAPAAGNAVKAQYVVATQISVVGNQRVINVRILETKSARLLGMHSDKAGFEDDALHPVAARAAIRLAAAARLDKAPEAPPKPVKPAEMPQEVKPRPMTRPQSTDEPVQTIIVPGEQPAPAPAPAPAPVLAPQPQPVEPPPVQGDSMVAARTDLIPDPSKLPAGAPLAHESGRKVNWATRVGIAIVGVVAGGWAPLMIPAGITGTTLLLMRAIENRSRLQERPHTRAEIASIKSQGQIFEVAAYMVGAGAAVLFLLGSAVFITAVVVALVLP